MGFYCRQSGAGTITPKSPVPTTDVPANGTGYVRYVILNEGSVRASGKV